MNVAARLEQLSIPNGICISSTVYHQVCNKLPAGFECLGEQALKNIDEPVAVWSWEPGGRDRSGQERNSASGLPAQYRTAIVGVLPFANLSDSTDEYFSDGLTEDLIHALSLQSFYRVLSRNSTFSFKDQSVSTRLIAREIDATYLIQGSVRRAGNKVRITTQLSDAETNSLVWADRFEHATDELFTLQDEVTSQIAVALNLEMVGAEAARPTSNPDALDYILRGRAAFYHHEGSTPERFAYAIECFERAMAVDPRSVDTRALLALALTGRVLEQATRERLGRFRRQCAVFLYR